MRIIIVGRGNVATNLDYAFRCKGVECTMVSSREGLDTISQNADVYIYAVRDEVSGNAPVRKPRWYFMDANTKLSVLRSFFINLPVEGIKLPPVSDRVLR